MQAPRTERYLVETHICKTGDSWEVLSKEKYSDVAAASALRPVARKRALELVAALKALRLRVVERRLRRVVRRNSGCRLW